MRLLPLTAFVEIFQPLCGKRIGYVRARGNVGDKLIEAATFQLFDAFDIDWRIVDPCRGEDVDEIVFAGGGNMGTLYPYNRSLREQALQLGLPLTIFPQSFNAAEDRPYRRVFVRERASLAFACRATLAPDLALGFDFDNRVASRGRGTGVFIRKDGELGVRRPWFSRDPAKICATPLEYLQLAARYERIVTDRLHFAICALIVGREAILLPNSYHKNYSMHQTWLANLGCKFAWSVRAALRGDREAWVRPEETEDPAIGLTASDRDRLAA